MKPKTFKRGDKVVIKKDLLTDPVYLINDRYKYFGKTVTIVKKASKYKDEFFIKEDGNDYIWTAEMFE